MISSRIRTRMTSRIRRTRIRRMISSSRSRTRTRSATAATAVCNSREDAKRLLTHWLPARRNPGEGARDKAAGRR